MEVACGAAYTDESALQHLIQSSPELLAAGSEADPLVVARELYVPSTGPVDIAAVNASGAIILIECKLRANPEIRRHVIGQLLAYASGIWRLSYEDFDRAFSDRTGQSLAEAMRAVIGPTDEFDEELFRSEVSRRLEAGQFRLIVAVDEITDELRRIVEYGNVITRAGCQLLAMELRYIADGDVELLIPSTYGTEMAESKQRLERQAYDWDSYVTLGIPSDRIQVGRALLEAVEAAIGDRDLPWQPVFRKGYIAIQRRSGYNVAIIDVFYNAVPRFAIKIPASPDELGLTDPYAGRFRTTWGNSEHEWGWTIETVDAIPDLGRALDMALPYHPASGPMVSV